MKVKVIEAQVEACITIASMPFGSIGITSTDKRIYLRTHGNAICLNDFGASYINNANHRNDPGEDAIQLFPRGTIIQIEVD